jgi:hypothetical protein
MAHNHLSLRRALLIRRLLEGPRWWLVHDLLEAMPEDLACTPRTIRRHLEALEFVGEPLECRDDLADQGYAWRLHNKQGDSHAPSQRPRR